MTKELALALTLFGVAAAWVGFAEHPTARQLRKAVITTAIAALG
jgi:hypothetical protein